MARMPLWSAAVDTWRCEDSSVAQQSSLVMEAGPSTHATGSGSGSTSIDGNVRLQRFSEALEKFLALIDERATKENFRTALPDLDERVLEGARKQLVFHLKDAIKVEKDRLVESYDLDTKLAELEQLTRQADAWNEKHGRSRGKPKDAWRPGLDLATALSAPSILVQRETNAQLEAELQSLLAENDEAHAQLTKTLEDCDAKRTAASSVLDTLDETIAALNTSPEQEERLRRMIDALAAELGPRGLE